MVFVGMGIVKHRGVIIDMDQHGYNKFNVRHFGKSTGIRPIEETLKKMNINNGSGVVVNNRTFKPLKFRK
jgi:hypothetical protein